MKTRDVPAPDMPSEKNPEQWLSEDGLRPVPHSTDETKGDDTDASPKDPGPATDVDEKPSSLRTS